jgi:glycine dehydrogenase subunit 1
VPFSPHTDEEIPQHARGRSASRASTTLFDEIPAKLRVRSLDAVPEQVSEMEISRIMHERAARDGQPLCFIGAGAYEHHIPAAIWEIATRGEYYSAYTPYQAEASQGTLQLIYEFQTMMCGLTGLDVSNASLYEGASALAEAVLMAVRGHRKSRSRRVLVAGRRQSALRAGRAHDRLGTGHHDRDAALRSERGTALMDALERNSGQDVTALVVQQPNYFGQLEEVDALADWAHDNNALLVAVANPTSLALLRAPREWGAHGADIACGEGQPLGVPLASGGPYFGFLTCREALMRQMPGRIVGRTVDLNNRPGFTLTLQAREQHIRRSKATSNICTNQGLMVTGATIYLSLLGPEGLARVAALSHVRTNELVKALTQIPGVRLRFGGPRFHEAVLALDRPVRGSARGARGTRHSRRLRAFRRLSTPRKRAARVRDRDQKLTRHRDLRGRAARDTRRRPALRSGVQHTWQPSHCVARKSTLRASCRGSGRRRPTSRSRTRTCGT